MASSTEAAHNVLITAASGHIGQQLVPFLQSQPTAHQLFLLTSNAANLQKGLSSTSRVTICEGDITNVLWIEKIMQEHGIDTLFMCLTGADELFLSANMISAVQNAGCVKHLIYLSAAGDLSSVEAIKSGKLGSVLNGNVLSKLPIEQILYYGLPAPGSAPGAFSWTILGPSLFYDNDLRAKEAIEKGIFPEPMGPIGCSRVSTLDISLGVLRAIEDAGVKWHGRKIMIGSKKLYNDAAISELWSKAMQRNVVCRSDAQSLANVETTISATLNASLGRVLRLMYESFCETGFGISDDEYATQVEFLGREPERYEDFVAVVSEKWRSGQTVGTSWSRLINP